jgi:hypothetical protein
MPSRYSSKWLLRNLDHLISLRVVTCSPILEAKGIHSNDAPLLSLRAMLQSRVCGPRQLTFEHEFPCSLDEESMYKKCQRPLLPLNSLSCSFPALASSQTPLPPKQTLYFFTMHTSHLPILTLLPLTVTPRSWSDWRPNCLTSSEAATLVAQVSPSTSKSILRSPLRSSRPISNSLATVRFAQARSRFP